MKQIICTPIFLLLVNQLSLAQKYVSTQSTVSFYSKAPVEDIEAKSNKGKSIIDLSTNEIVFSIPITSFQFEKSLMQEHFNEKYMESDKYPQAIYKGKIEGFDIKKNGVQKVKAKGKLTIHEVEQSIETEGEMIISTGKITLNHSFKVVLKDHKIKIPKLLWQNIAEVVDVNITFDYKVHEK